MSQGYFFSEVDTISMRERAPNEENEHSGAQCVTCSRHSEVLEPNFIRMGEIFAIFRFSRVTPLNSAPRDGTINATACCETSKKYNSYETNHSVTFKNQLNRLTSKIATGQDSISFLFFYNCRFDLTNLQLYNIFPSLKQGSFPSS